MTPRFPAVTLGRRLVDRHRAAAAARARVNRQEIRGRDDSQRIVDRARPGDLLTFDVFVPGLNRRGPRTLRVETR